LIPTLNSHRLAWSLPLLLVCIWPLPLKATAQTLQGTVVSVGDGDTIRVSASNKVVTTRLACVDAAETAQKPWGLAATQRLKQLLPVGTPVTLRIADIDRYGRSVAKVYRGDLSINLALVQEGQAVVYRQYLGACPELKEKLLKAETSAKARKLGFWNQTNPQMPWDFRRGQQTAAPTPSIPPGAIQRAVTTSGKTGLRCSDFKTHAEAQAALPNNPQLDRDKDGVACESLR